VLLALAACCKANAIVAVQSMIHSHASPGENLTRTKRRRSAIIPLTVLNIQFVLSSVRARIEMTRFVIIPIAQITSETRITHVIALVTAVDKPPMNFGSSAEGMGRWPNCEYAVNHETYTAVITTPTADAGTQPIQEYLCFMIMGVGSVGLCEESRRSSGN
jgi:hypothetical protein